MANVLSDLPHAAAVAVIRLRSLGDCVLTTPALALLHAHRPDLRVGVVVEEHFAAVFEGNPAVRAILPPTIPALRQWNAQLCVNLHGGTRSMTMTASSGARVRAGFDHFRYAGVYNVRIPRAQEILGVDRVVHTAEHLASAVFYLGVPVQPIPRASLWGARVPRVDRRRTRQSPACGDPPCGGRAGEDVARGALPTGGGATRETARSGAGVYWRPGR
jgi:heptosyltransferase III